MVRAANASMARAVYAVTAVRGAQDAADRGGAPPPPPPQPATPPPVGVNGEGSRINVYA